MGHAFAGCARTVQVHQPAIGSEDSRDFQVFVAADHAVATVIEADDFIGAQSWCQDAFEKYRHLVGHGNAALGHRLGASLE
jgi:hypothetical protein